MRAAREHSVQRSLITEDGAVIGERLFCLVGPASQRPDNLQSKCQVGKRQTWPSGSRADRDKARVKDVTGQPLSSNYSAPKPSQTANNTLAATTAFLEYQKDKWSSSAEH